MTTFISKIASVAIQDDTCCFRFATYCTSAVQMWELMAHAIRDILRAFCIIHAISVLYRFFLLICWIWIIFSHNSCFYADDKMLFHMYTKIVICYVMLCYWRIGAWNITGIVSMYTSPSNHLTWHSVVPQPCDRSTARGASVVDRRK